MKTQINKMFADNEVKSGDIGDYTALTNNSLQNASILIEAHHKRLELNKHTLILHGMQVIGILKTPTEYDEKNKISHHPEGEITWVKTTQLPKYKSHKNDPTMIKNVIEGTTEDLGLNKTIERGDAEETLGNNNTYLNTWARHEYLYEAFKDARQLAFIQSAEDLCYKDAVQWIKQQAADTESDLYKQMHGAELPVQVDHNVDYDIDDEGGEDVSAAAGSAAPHAIAPPIDDTVKPLAEIEHLDIADHG